MKVTVSIPDPLFHDAERACRQLRVARSQLYSRALEAYVREHSDEEITVRMNSVVARLGRKLEPGWGNLGLEVFRWEQS